MSSYRTLAIISELNSTATYDLQYDLKWVMDEVDEGHIVSIIALVRLLKAAKHGKITLPRSIAVQVGSGIFINKTLLNRVFAQHFECIREVQDTMGIRLFGCCQNCPASGLFLGETCYKLHQKLMILERLLIRDVALYIFSYMF